MIRIRSGKRLFAIVMLAAGITASACDSVTEPTSPIGHYSLASVNGDKVPSTMFEDATFKLEYTGGTLDVEADGTYIATVISLETVDINESEYVDSLQGTWTQDETGTMQFTLNDDASTFTGAWQGRRVTVLVTSGLNSSSLLYQRR